MAAMTETFIVLCGQIVGGNGPFETVYSFDGERFEDRKKAIDHGFTKGRSDDFNIGVLRDGRLVSLDWMDAPVDTDRAVLDAIELQIGLKP